MNNFLEWIKDHKFWAVILLIVIVTILSFVIPLLISALFIDNGIPVKYEAKDYLAFYGSFLAFLGTTVLGGITIYQNNKIAGIEKNLLKPVLSYENCKLVQNGNYDESLFNLLFNINAVEQFQISAIPIIKLNFKNTTDKHIKYKFENIQFREKTRDNPEISHKISGWIGKETDISLEPFQTSSLNIILCKNEIQEFEKMSFVRISFILTNCVGHRYREIIELCTHRVIKDNIVITDNGIKQIEQISKY